MEVAALTNNSPLLLSKEKEEARSMNTKASNAVGGRTARACDSCLIKRARWFCAADDAFLCQSCDGAVHSANQLASRHERVRLETASCKVSTAPAPPAWHTKKARTPRQAKSKAAPHHQLPVVPEMSSDEAVPEADDQLFSCRVPVLDMEEELGFGFDDDAEHELNLDELLSSCCDDVEGFLGHGDGIDGLMMMDHEKSVKVEDSCKAEELNWDLDFSFSAMEEGGEESDRIRVDKNRLLRLNYEAVIAAWASQGSPWTDGIRPHYCNLDDLINMGESDEWGSGGVKGRRDAGREARVSRYREKRRTRLFSKKIRYEVRKLNAEKRPRMKGRFVKRTNFLPMPHHLINKA